MRCCNSDKNKKAIIYDDRDDFNQNDDNDDFNDKYDKTQ